MNSRSDSARGKPLFKNLVRLAKPSLPGYEAFAEDVRGVFQSGLLSKGVALVPLTKHWPRT